MIKIIVLGLICFGAYSGVRVSKPLPVITKSPKLTHDEMKQLVAWIQEKIDTAQTDDERDYYERLYQHVYAGFYDQVIAELDEKLGTRERIFQVYRLRRRLLLHQLDALPLVLRHIAELPTKAFIHDREKVVYIRELFGQFRLKKALLSYELFNEVVDLLLDQLRGCLHLGAQQAVHDRLVEQLLMLKQRYNRS